MYNKRGGGGVQKDKESLIVYAAGLCAVCACTRVCWCRRIFTYIHT